MYFHWDRNACASATARAAGSLARAFARAAAYIMIGPPCAHAVYHAGTAAGRAFFVRRLTLL